jgi:hypothetical protein
VSARKPPVLGAELRRRLEHVVRVLDPGADPHAALEALVPHLPEAPALEDGLLSVVVRNHSLARLELLDEALFSLACSFHRPLQIVLVSQAVEAGARERLQALLDRHMALGEVSGSLVLEPSRDDRRARLLNLGVSAAHGRYLALLDDDDVVDPDHHARLVDALREGEAAWAVGRIRRADYDTGPDGALHCVSKRPWPLAARFDLTRLARDNDLPLHSWLLDRERLRGFRVAFDERLTRLEDYAFLLRIAAVFRPVMVPGAATAEYRFRGDGSNTTPHRGSSAAARVARERSWKGPRAEIARLKREIEALASAEELAEIAEAAERPVGEAREELRYRIADRVNDALKRAPGVHAVMKAWLDRRRNRR